MIWITFLVHDIIILSIVVLMVVISKNKVTIEFYTPKISQHKIYHNIITIAFYLQWKTFTVFLDWSVAMKFFHWSILIFNHIINNPMVPDKQQTQKNEVYPPRHMAHYSSSLDCKLNSYVYMYCVTISYICMHSLFSFVCQ